VGSISGVGAMSRLVAAKTESIEVLAVNSLLLLLVNNLEIAVNKFLFGVIAIMS
jgi:hypothetical protein